MRRVWEALVPPLGRALPWWFLAAWLVWGIALGYQLSWTLATGSLIRLTTVLGALPLLAAEGVAWRRGVTPLPERADWPVRGLAMFVGCWLGLQVHELVAPDPHPQWWDLTLLTVAALIALWAEAWRRDPATPPTWSAQVPWASIGLIALSLASAALWGVAYGPEALLRLLPVALAALTAMTWASVRAGGGAPVSIAPAARTRWIVGGLLAGTLLFRLEFSAGWRLGTDGGLWLAQVALCTTLLAVGHPAGPASSTTSDEDE